MRVQTRKVVVRVQDAVSFIQVGATSGIARIDTIPSKSPSPAPPDSVKPSHGSIVGTLADDALRPELRGNDEARRLMQETLLDEATFAAADAAENTGIASPLNPLGSPPLNLSYA